MSTATSYDTYPVTTENRAHYEAFYNPPAMVDGEYRYEVLVLGTRGAGKTTFLAAFYKQLSTPNVDRNNFWVELRDDRQRKFLVNTYHQLTNPNADWPPGSANVNEYEFRFCHPMDGRALPLFRFRYLDYPGGYLTDDVDGADSFDIAQITQKAHSILVLIDGQKVLQNIEELPIRGSSLDKDLDILIPMLNRCVHLPVHFVVTKWDVLETRRYTLARVRDELRRKQ
jgi:GTPase SAR1 family protein